MHLNFWAYVDVFTGHAWCATFVALVLGSLVHVLARHQEGPERGGDFSKDLGAVSLVYLLRDTPICRTRMSFRLVHVVNCFTGFLIFSFYTAVLTSVMTAAPPAISIFSFQVLLVVPYNALFMQMKCHL